MICLVLMVATARLMPSSWMVHYRHCAFFLCVCRFVCLSHFASLLKERTSQRLDISAHYFGNKSLMNDFCPTGTRQISNKRSQCVSINGSRLSSHFCGLTAFCFSDNSSHNSIIKWRESGCSCSLFFFFFPVKPSQTFLLRQLRSGDNETGRHSHYEDWI